MTVDDLRRIRKVTPGGQKSDGSVYKFTGNARRNVKSMSDEKLQAILITPPRNADQSVLWRRVQDEVRRRADA